MIWLLVAGLVFMVIYELLAARRGSSTLTISELFWKYSQRFPVIPFALGLLIGHLVFH